jgi:hypothetical protein
LDTSVFQHGGSLATFLGDGGPGLVFVFVTSGWAVVPLLVFVGGLVFVFVISGWAVVPLLVFVGGVWAGLSSSAARGLHAGEFDRFFGQ